MGKKKTYRGQRVQKSHKIGCGCFYCTGTNKEDRRLIEEKRIDKETEAIINNVDLYNVSKSFYCQSDIEMNGKCDEQCNHCKEYCKPLE